MRQQVKDERKWYAGSLKNRIVLVREYNGMPQLLLAGRDI